jgi:GNAT superfamily N-acetyltransferase
MTRAISINWRNLALGHRSLEAEGATFVRNTDFPSIYDANFIYNVTASTPDEIESLVARARKEYAHCNELTFRLGPDTPAEFTARLALEGHARGGGALVLLLEGDLRGEAKPADIRPIDSEAGWSAYIDLKRADWREHAARIGEDPENMAVPDGLAATNRLKSPPARYFMAYVGGAPVGFFDAWEGEGGVGQVEDLFVLPEHRNKGIATALLHHCVADARAKGAGPIVIVADPTDTPKNIYARMGWHPIALCLQYGVKLVS